MGKVAVACRVRQLFSAFCVDVDVHILLPQLSAGSVTERWGKRLSSQKFDLWLLYVFISPSKSHVSLLIEAEETLHGF